MGKKMFPFKAIGILAGVIFTMTTVSLLWAGLVTKPYTFVNGTVADADQVNSDFDTVYTLVNGNLSAPNLATHSVTETKIDWGTGADQVSAVNVPVADALNLYTTDNLEAATQEIPSATWTLTNKTLDTPWIHDSGGTEHYKVAVSNLAADRTVTLPLLAGNDEFVFKDFLQTLTNKSLTSPDIDGGTIDNNTIGGNTPAVGTFTTANATTFDTNVVTAGVTLTGTTLQADGTDADININVTPKGTGSVVVSKVDINAGAIDGTTIGGSSAAAGTFTTLNAPGMPPIGSIIPFYDFNALVTFDTGYWKYCDGTAIVNASSPLNGQTSPDLSNRYLVGFGTEAGGNIGDLTTGCPGAANCWATAAVGNASHQVNLQHSHTINDHTHTTDIGHGHSNSFSASTSVTLSIASGGSHDHGGYTQDLSTTAWAETHTPTNYRVKDDSGGWAYHPAYWLGVDGGVGGSTQGFHDHNIGSDGSHAHSGSSASASTTISGSVTSYSGSSTSGSPSNKGMDNQLSTTQTIQPRSVRVRYIMRVL